MQWPNLFLVCFNSSDQTYKAKNKPTVQFSIFYEEMLNWKKLKLLEIITYINENGSYEMRGVTCTWSDIEHFWIRSFVS